MVCLFSAANAAYIETVRKRKDRPEDIKEILNKIMGRIEKRGPDRKEKILNAWQRIVGEKASRHSRPINIRRKVLTIEIDSSTWLYTLNLKKNSILKDMKKELKKELKDDKVNDLRFRMGDIT